MDADLRLFRYIAPSGARIGLAREGRVVDLTSVSGFESLAAWLSLLIAPSGKLIGYTLGNDMSSRDIEGANPLYLPQAKVYRESCALGPVIVLEEEPREHREFSMRMRITRGGESVFIGETSTDRM